MLHGFTIGITADRRFDEQASLFERRGAAVQHGPTIRTIPLGSDTNLHAATDAVIAGRPAALIANTGVGIRSWFSAAETWGVGDDLTAALAETRIYARGPKASGAVHAYGLEVTAKGVTERLTEVVNLAIADLAAGDLVAVQLDGSGMSDEVGRLRDAGLAVIEIPVYEWKMPDDVRPAIRLAEGVISGRVHAVTFTAGPAIRNWMAIAAEHGIEDDLRAALNDERTVVGCVGPVCAEAALAAGIVEEQLVVPETWRLGPLVRSVADRLVTRAVTIEVGGKPLVITGNVVTIDDNAVAFTDTEARVLSMLAARPNVVHAKADLLRNVWRDESADPHVVEVAVARLRRRLGAQGSSIASVHRRGYVLRTTG